LITAYHDAIEPDDQQKIRQKVWDKVVKAEKLGLLPVVLARLIAKVPQIPADKKDATTAQLLDVIENRIKNNNFASWAVVGESLKAAVGGKSQDDAALAKDLESLERALGFSPTLVTSLSNPSPRGKTRLAKIDGAQKSIWIFAWAFYTDNAGQQAADLLVKKAQQGKEVKIIVDGPPVPNPVILK